MYALLKAGQDRWGKLSTSSKVIVGGSAVTSAAMVLSGVNTATATIFGGLAALAVTAYAQQQTELTSRIHQCVDGGELRILEHPTNDPALDGATVYSRDLAQNVTTTNINLCDALSEGAELKGTILRGDAGISTIWTITFALI